MLRLSLLLAVSCSLPPSNQQEERHLSSTQAHVDVASYDLVARFDWEARRLFATVTITLEQPLAGTLTLDSQVDRIVSVQANNVSLTFVQKATQLDITLVEATKEILIEYEAVPSAALSAIERTPGDPIEVRTLYTYTEPVGTPLWMPVHNTPADRARFGLTATLPLRESVVSNGLLIFDRHNGDGTHTVQHSTDYTIPQYLMAFAFGDFVTETVMHGSVPVSVVYRRGYPLESTALLDELVRMLGVFEALVGPYPFQRYSLVLLPGFPGGIEHAEITFQNERSTSASRRDLRLSAHELAHHWFGNWVTAADWTDVWIKEGMATLLESEALRAYEDQSQSQTLTVDDGWIRPAPMRKLDGQPHEQYFGAYDRSAWWLTQVRALVGEQQFWMTLRLMLADHAQGHIDSDSFLSLWDPLLGAGGAAARFAIDQPSLPQLTAQAFEDGSVQMMLAGAANGLLVPVTFQWRNAHGITREQFLTQGNPVGLQRQQPDEYLIVDPKGIHPMLGTFAADASSSAAIWRLADLSLPQTPEALLGLLSQSGLAQQAAFEAGLPPSLTPEQLPGLLAALASETAKFTLVSHACADARFFVPVRTFFEAALLRPLGVPAQRFDLCDPLLLPSLADIQPDIALSRLLFFDALQTEPRGGVGI